MSPDAEHQTYAGNPLTSSSPVVLPETMVNRAQTVTRAVMMRWLRGVITGDRNGYAVLSGGGRTILVLYGDQTPLSAAVIRGPDVGNMVEALEALRVNSPSDFFAMTYDLPEGAPRSLSGLFAGPASRRRLDRPRPQLKAMLEELMARGYSGSILLRHQLGLWAVMLLADGDIIGCYGSDDTELKGSARDAAALLQLDSLETAIYPAFTDDRLAEAISFGSTSYLGGSAGGLAEETEVAMIALLSELEAAISAITADDPPEKLVYSLIASYRTALDLIQTGPEVIGSKPLAHPLLESHWLPEQRSVDTEGLARTLEMAAIPEAWLAAADALILALETTVEQQLTWLSMSDKLTAATLKATLADLLGQARTRLGGWRQARRSTTTTNRPLADGQEGMTILR